MFTNPFAESLLKLVFQGQTITGIARDDATPLTEYFASLHTSDPGANGNQGTNELAYTEYARIALSRSSTNFTITGNVMNPTTDIEWAEMLTGVGGTATHMVLGTEATGTGIILARFELTPSISVQANVTPRVRDTTTLTLVTSA